MEHATTWILDDGRVVIELVEPSHLELLDLERGASWCWIDSESGIVRAIVEPPEA